MEKLRELLKEIPKEETGFNYEYYWDRLQEEISANEAGMNLVKPSTPNLRESQIMGTGSTPDETHELEVFQANMVIQSEHNQPIHVWPNLLKKKLTKPTQREMNSTSKIPWTVVAIGNFLYQKAYPKVKRQMILQKRIQKAMENQTDLAKITEILIHLYRCYGLYNFQMLKAEIEEKVDSNTRVAMMNISTMTELDKYTKQYGYVSPNHNQNKTFQIDRTEIPHYPVSATTETSIYQCLKAIKNLKLQCWECGGQGHGVMGCPTLAEKSRAERFQRYKELAKVKRVRTDWETSDTKQIREKAFVVGAEAVCSECGINTHIENCTNQSLSDNDSDTTSGLAGYQYDSNQTNPSTRVLRHSQI